MNLTQDWVGYLDRSYEQIKQSLINRLKISVPEVTDHTESNLLIIIISMFSGIAEMLNVYIDRMARETFLGTAKRFSSIVKIVSLLDYRIKTATPASVNLKFTVIDSLTSLPTTTHPSIVVPQGTIVTSLYGLQFVTQYNLTIPTGSEFGLISANQYTAIFQDDLGATDGTPSQKVDLGFGVVNNSLLLTINLLTYTQVESLGLALPNDRVFIVSVGEDTRAYLQFGDGVNGAIPPSGYTILGDYKVTAGLQSNVPPNSITSIESTIPTPAGYTVTVDNPLYASGGKDYQTLEEVRNLAPLSIRTLDRAVTKQDYEDLALLIPGISHSKASFCCGDACVKLYVGSSTVGEPTSSVLREVERYFECRQLLGRCITALPAGLSKLYFDIDIIVYSGFILEQTRIKALTALNSTFGYANSIINKEFLMATFISTVKSVPGVKNVVINSIWVEPYARRVNPNSPDLVWQRSIGLGNSHSSFIYRFNFDATFSRFNIYKDGFLSGYAYFNIPYQDGTLNFIIEPGVYSQGDAYDIITQPSNSDFILGDHSILATDIRFEDDPISGFFNINMILESASGSCSENC